MKIDAALAWKRWLTERPTRIAIMTYHADDYPSYWFGLSRAMARRGHRMTYIATSHDHRFRAHSEQRDGVRVFATPFGVTGRWHYGGWGPHDIASRIHHLRHGNYDVLVGLDCRANVVLPFRAMAGQIPVRIAAWTDWWGPGGLSTDASRFSFQRRLEQKWERAMKIEADGVAVCSRLLGEVGHRWGIDEQRICWIPPGSPRHVHRLPRGAARRTLGFDENRPIVGYLGYNLGDLPACFPALRQLFDRYPDSIVLCLGRYDEAGRRVASDWGINAHVRFSGYVPNPELETWLACADVFLIPLLAESVNDFYRSPGRLADYCAAGRPVVAPDIGETGRVIRDEGIGLTAAQDMSDLDRQLGRLIDDHDLAEQLGARARELAETTLAEDTLAERLEDFVAGIYRRQIG